MVGQGTPRRPINLTKGPAINPISGHGVAAGNLLLFSGIRGSEESPVFFTGDPTEQARRCFENLKALLAAEHASLDHVARITVYLDDFKWRPFFEEVWAEYFPDNPPARLMLKAGNSNEDPMGNAYYLLDVIAVQPGQPLRETIGPPEGAPPLDPHTVGAVKAGGFLFFSGVRGADASSNVYLPSDPNKQVTQAFENLKLYTNAAGGSLDNLARVVVHFHDLKYRAAFNDYWAEQFSTNRPARIAFTADNANEHPEGNAHFVLDVIGVAPGYPLRKEFYIVEGGAPHGPGSVAGSIANGMIFCAAMRGGTQNVFFNSDPKGQAERAFINLGFTMEGAGATLDHVAKITVHYENLRFRQVFEEKWAETFPTNPPALTQLKAGSANHTPLSNAYFVLDVIAAAP